MFHFRSSPKLVPAHELRVRVKDSLTPSDQEAIKERFFKSIVSISEKEIRYYRHIYHAIGYDAMDVANEILLDVLRTAESVPVDEELTWPMVYTTSKLGFRRVRESAIIQNLGITAHRQRMIYRLIGLEHQFSDQWQEMPENKRAKLLGVSTLDEYGVVEESRNKVTQMGSAQPLVVDSDEGGDTKGEERALRTSVDAYADYSGTVNFDEGDYVARFDGLDTEMSATRREFLALAALVALDPVNLPLSISSLNILSLRSLIPLALKYVLIKLIVTRPTHDR